MSDVDTLARTIYGEARGEGVRGMEAVAAVVMNRVKADLGNDGKPDWWGEGVEGVCRKPWQFSCWLPNDPNRDKLLAVTSRDPWFAHAIEIAKRAIAGELVDPTGGATHYVTKAVADRTAWAKGKTPVADIGRHLFYRL
jgi:N-acetylmuramoyl-L-alanine amidase